jgi:hypothetical protein
MCAGSPKEERVRAEPVLQMAPPHTCLINSNKRAGRAHTTCVSFGNRGDKVLAHSMSANGTTILSVAVDTWSESCWVVW